MTTLDFAPATTTLARLVAQTGDDQLSAPTPCADYTVGDLVEHVGGLAHAFICSARKAPVEIEQTDGDAGRLEEGWRERIVADLDALALAWADPAAYDGMTEAGPIEMPAAEAAKVALNEVVVHGWDLAVATGRTYDTDPMAAAECLAFVASFDAPANDDGGLFGPTVEVSEEAPTVDRLLGLTGRDPRGM